jgi:hypothetical protein
MILLEVCKLGKYRRHKYVILDQRCERILNKLLVTLIYSAQQQSEMLQ